MSATFLSENLNIYRYGLIGESEQAVTKGCRDIERCEKRKRKAVSILSVLLIGVGLAFCYREPVLYQVRHQIHRFRKLWEAESARGSGRFYILAEQKSGCLRLDTGAGDGN